MKRTGLPTFLVLTIATALAPVCLGQSDNFDDGNDDGWTRYDPQGTLGQGPQASYFFTNGGYRIQAHRDPALAQTGPARAGSYRTNEYSDFEITADIVNWDDSLNQSIGLLARMTQVGFLTTDGYALTYQPASDDIDISHFTDEGARGIISLPLSPDDITMVPGRSYRYVWIGRGNQFAVRIYELPNLETPILDATGMDDTLNPYTNGVCGFLVYDTGGTAGIADATFDNYSASVPPPPPPPPPPRLDIVRTTDVEGVIVCWRTNAVGFVLQLTDDLSRPTPSWSDITEGIFVNQETGRYEYFEFTSSASQLFFRLRKPPE